MCHSNKCYLVHSWAFLLGKILHRSDGKVDILCHTFHINPRIIKVTSAPFIIPKVDENNILIKYKILCFLPLSCAQTRPVKISSEIYFSQEIKSY